MGPAPAARLSRRQLTAIGSAAARGLTARTSAPAFPRRGQPAASAVGAIIIRIRRSRATPASDRDCPDDCRQPLTFSPWRIASRAGFPPLGNARPHDAPNHELLKKRLPDGLRRATSGTGHVLQVLPLPGGRGSKAIGPGTGARPPRVATRHGRSRPSRPSARRPGSLPLSAVGRKRPDRQAPIKCPSAWPTAFPPGIVPPGQGLWRGPSPRPPPKPFEPSPPILGHRPYPHQGDTMFLGRPKILKKND
jgi:hypothetical protein